MGNGPDFGSEKFKGTQLTERLGKQSTGTQSNLRDFRIDESPQKELSTPRGFASQKFQDPGVPKQTVVSRNVSSSVNEWTDSDEDFLNSQSGIGSNSESLWGDWKQELEQTTQPKIQNRAPAIQQPQPEENSGYQPLKAEEFAEPSWAAELALAERKAEREGYVDFTNSYQKQEILKSRTLEFLSSLQKAFREQVEIFNLNRKSPAHAIQIYKVSKTASDFMLFRNGVKLVVSGQRSGRVLFAFNQYLGQIFSPAQNPSIEIEAEWGPFDQLFWSYKNERVQISDIVRYFMLEFVNQSFK